jgi:hypothetical protein
LEELLAEFGALGFDDFAAGKHDVLALVVDLDDFEFVNVADVFVEILRRDDVHLRAGKEGFDADVDGEAAFDDAFDLAADETAVLEDLDDLFPVLFVGGFFLREDDHALVVFEFFEQDFDFVADFDFLVFEFRKNASRKRHRFPAISGSATPHSFSLRLVSGNIERSAIRQARG